MFGTVASAVVLFGSGLTLLIGLEQLTGQKGYERPRLLLFAVSILVSIILLNYLSFYSGIALQHPRIMFLFFTSVYAVGPLNYLYYRSLVEPGMRAGPDGAHLLLPLLILIMETVFQFQGEELRQAIVAGFHGRVPGIAGTVFVAGGLSFAAYQMYFIVLCLRLLRTGALRRGVMILLVLECWNVLTLIPLGLWVLGGPGDLLLAAGMMTAAVMIFIFLFNRRFPGLFLMMGREIARKRYERSFLKGIDTRLVGRRLEELMQGERLYRDFEISLQSLAERLSLGTHQLSEFLNGQMGINFSSFVNGYRVEEAKKLLQGEDITILAVCFQVGFSSKSSFNSVFKSFTGMTPREYRESKKAEKNGAQL